VTLRRTATPPYRLPGVTPVDPDERRAASREVWEGAAGAWERYADRVREWGMPVSVAMVESLDLQPGQRVLELAAGPGDTGFMAAELVAPSGTLISSDGAEAMLEVARRRAAAAGVRNVEFQQLELEWIDLPTATVDAVLVRWGIMLIVDPEAAAREVRRVLTTGGHAAFAVWDVPQRNPWATIPSAAMVELGHFEPPDPDAPGMFALAPPDRLTELLQSGGFTEVDVVTVDLVRRYTGLEEYVAETAQVSPLFRAAWTELSAEQQGVVTARIATGVLPYTADDGAVALPGSSLVARASA
jgi:SAM-dependent methyltransferase